MPASAGGLCSSQARAFCAMLTTLRTLPSAGNWKLTRDGQIFAINTIVPMLSVVYWKGKFPTRYQFGMNAATLLGSMLGQVTFGILADRYGRRKMYGLELVVTIGASLGFATASSGVNNSMSLIALLIFWRAVSTFRDCGKSRGLR